MADERWAAVWELFNSAYDKPAGQRSALLKSDSLDPEVRSEVLSLLEVSSFCTARPSLPVPAAPSPEYPVGYEIGRYMIVGLIGQGGFGRIYAAHDRDLRRVVALKILAGAAAHRSRPPDRRGTGGFGAQPPEHRDGLRNNLRGRSTCDRHGVCRRTILAPTSASGAPAPLPVEKIVRYGRQMAEALNAAHAAGITHGDVKPENILVRKDEYVKLVDFGLATNVVMTSTDAGAGLLAGTLRYLSPEQLKGETSSQASDVFSLGLVLYEMTTGSRTPLGRSPRSKRRARSPHRNRSLHHAKCREFLRNSIDLILKMLAKDSAARPSTAEVEQALAQIASASERRTQRRRVWFAAAAVAVLGVSALVISQSIRKPAPFSLRLNTRPLTGEEGRETQPALSPDGRFVVYRWQSTADANRSLSFEKSARIEPQFFQLPALSSGFRIVNASALSVTARTKIPFAQSTKTERRTDDSQSPKHHGRRMVF